MAATCKAAYTAEDSEESDSRESLEARAEFLAEWLQKAFEKRAIYSFSTDLS